MSSEMAVTVALVVAVKIAAVSTEMMMVLAAVPLPRLCQSKQSFSQSASQSVIQPMSE